MTSTILWQDGFDLYASDADLSLVYSSGSGGHIRTTSGRFGGGAYQGGGSFGLPLIAPIASNPEVWISFAYNCVDTGSTPLLGWVAGTSTPEGDLRYDPTTGVWLVQIGANGATLASGSYMLTSGFHWVDFRIKIGTTTGEVELWVDDNQVFDVTGLNTVAHSGYTNVIAVSIGATNVGSNSSYFDDLLVYTGTRLGDSRIETVVPTSDASPNQGTPSTGTTHYGVVDELQNDTTDYLTMPNTSGDKEVFGTAGIVSTPASIWSVKVLTFSEKSDAGSYQLEPLVISNGTEGDGSAQQLTTTYGVQSTVFQTDPHTSAAWTYANVNAANIGFKVP